LELSLFNEALFEDCVDLIALNPLIPVPASLKLVFNVPDILKIIEQRS